jgi:MFS family permease
MFLSSMAHCGAIRRTEGIPLKERQRIQFYISVFVASLGVSMYMYFIPTFAQSFGATFLDLGIIGTVWSFATAVTPLLIGHFADRMNRAWIWVLSLTINAVATVVLVFSTSLFDIILLRLFGGIGMGAFWSTGEIVVTDITPPEGRVKEMGRYAIALAAGALMGPFIGGLIIEALGYLPLFVISTAVIVVAVVQAIARVVPGYSRKGDHFSLSSLRVLPTIRGLLPWYLMLFCYGVVWSLLGSIFPGYANSTGVGAALIGFLFSAFGVARIFSYATVHRYTRFGEKRVLLFSSALIFCGLLIQGALPNFISFLVGILLIGAGEGVVFPITINLIASHFPLDRAGIAVASYESSVNIGETVSPYLAGFLASMINIESSFLVMSVFGALMALFVWKGQAQMTRE